MSSVASSIGVAVLCVCLGATQALAQKTGGILRAANSANPVSLSILEEVSIATVQPAAPIFNNLVMFDPTKPREKSRYDHSGAGGKLAVG